MKTLNDFIVWNASADVIVTKKLYVDACEDLVAGMLLAKIAYYLLIPSIYDWSFVTKKDGEKYLIKKQDEWYDEIRISVKQYRRAINLLMEKGLISVEYHKHGGLRITHIKINEDILFDKLSQTISNYAKNITNKKHSGVTPDKLPDVVVVKEYLDKRTPEYRDWWKEYCKMRSKIKKPLTPRAQKMKITKLQKYFNDDFDKHISLFKRSIEKSWQDLIYPSDIGQTNNPNNKNKYKEGY